MQQGDAASAATRKRLEDDEKVWTAEQERIKVGQVRQHHADEEEKKRELARQADEARRRHEKEVEERAKERVQEKEEAAHRVAVCIPIHP